METKNNALETWKAKYEANTETSQSNSLQEWQSKYMSPVGEKDLRDSSARKKYAQRTEEKETTSGGYYNLPEASERGQYERALTYSSYKSGEKEKEAQSALREMEGKQRTLELAESHLQHLYDEYSTNRSDKYAELYNKAWGEYEVLYDDYSASADRYTAAYSAYADEIGGYNRIYNMYDSYEREQAEAYNAWRETVREESAVQQELDRIDAQISALERAKQPILASWLDKAFGVENEEEEKRRNAIEKLKKERALLADELDWSRYFLYDAYTREEDFPALSQYRSTATGKEIPAYAPAYTLGVSTGLTTKGNGFADVAYDAINGNNDAKYRDPTYSGREEMTDYEISIFDYLYAKDEENGDKEHKRAWKYIDDITGDLNYRQRERYEAEAAAYAKEHPVLSSIGSALASPLSSITAIGQVADYLKDGKIDQNAQYNALSYMPKAAKEEVSKQVKKNWGGAGSFLYNTGMSLAENAVRILATGGSKISLAIASTGAFANEIIDAKDRGLGDNQAFALGTIAGLAEAITENVSLETLLDRTSMGKSAVGYVLKNVLSEGSEEIGSDIINLLADIVISQDQSEWNRSIQAYMDDGKSESEAFGLAVGDQALEMGLDFLGGALSGGVMAGGNIALNQASNAMSGIKNKLEARKARLAEQNEIVKSRVPLNQVENMNQAKDTKDKQTNRMQAQEQAGESSDKLTTADLPTAEEVMNANAEKDTAIEVETNDVPEMAENLRNETNDADTESAVNPKTEQTENEEAGTITEKSGRKAGADEEQIRTAERIGKAVNRDIVFFEDKGDANGIVNAYYNREDGRIYVNTKSKQVMEQSVAHELTHSIEVSRAYQQKLSRYVLDRIQQSEDLGKLRETTKSLYHKKGVDLSGKDVDAEIVAKYVADHLLTNEQEIMELVQSSPTLGQTIRNWIDRVLAKFGNKAAKERVFLEKARDYYAAALRETQESASKARTLNEIHEREQQLRRDYGSGKISDEEFDAEFDALMEEEAMAGGNTLNYGKDGESGRRSYSIEDIEGEKQDYGTGVILDTDLFKGVKQRKWGKVLQDYVYQNMAGTELTVYDENGNAEVIYIAKTNDRVRKDGAKNSHRVIDELARYKGDSVRAVATVHLPEIAEVSTYKESGTEHRHQWMDSNGWEFRTAFLQDRAGNIYEATLNIANGEGRRILYDINNIRKIDKKRNPARTLPLPRSRGGLRLQQIPLGNMISHSVWEVKWKVKISQIMKSRT